MKTAVLSDVHANLEALTVVLDHAYGLGVEAVVCLGDVVGYNADPIACIDVLRDDPRIRCILGNHDAMAVGRGPLIGINDQAHEAMTWTRRQLNEDHRSWLAGLPLSITDPDATYVHASLDEPSIWKYVHQPENAIRHLMCQTTPVSFVGHSHTIFAWALDGDTPVFKRDMQVNLEEAPRWLLSVGSVGQPRDGDSRAGYALYDPEAGRVVYHRIDYDVAVTRRKILEAGLPAGLAERL